MSQGASKVVLVTGAAAGIGRATALRFARAGWTAAIWDISPRLEEVGGEIAALGGSLHLDTVDVSRAAEVEAAMERLGETCGRLDAVVANAGIVRDAQLLKWRGGQAAGRMSEEDFDQVLDTNLKGVFLTVRAAAPWLIRAGGGSVAVASSVVAHSGNFGQTNYAAAKARSEERRVGKEC